MSDMPLLHLLSSEAETQPVLPASNSVSHLGTEQLLHSELLKQKSPGDMGK